MAEEANTKLWVAGEDVYETLRELIARHHPHLADIDDKIAVLFKEKRSKSGDVEVTGKTTKASPQLSILTKEGLIFVITLAADYWQEISDAQRIALLDHHLYSCRAEEKDGGMMRYYVSPPDIGFYKEELEHHGCWRTSGASLSMETLGALFGADEI